MPPAPLATCATADERLYFACVHLPAMPFPVPVVSCQKMLSSPCAIARLRSFAHFRNHPGWPKVHGKLGPIVVSLN